MTLSFDAAIHSWCRGHRQPWIRREDNRLVLTTPGKRGTAHRKKYVIDRRTIWIFWWLVGQYYCRHYCRHSEPFNKRLAGYRRREERRLARKQRYSFLEG